MQNARNTVCRISFILALACLGALVIGLAGEVMLREVIFGEGYRSGFYSWALIFTAIHFFSWPRDSRKAAGRKRYIMPVAVILLPVLLILGAMLWETSRHLLPVLALVPILATYFLWPRKSTEKCTQDKNFQGEEESVACVGAEAAQLKRSSGPEGKKLPEKESGDTAPKPPAPPPPQGVEEPGRDAP